MLPRRRAVPDLRDRGSVAAELTLLTPLLICLVLLIVAAGRLVSAQQKVTDAAHQAARAASTQPTPANAEHAATSEARAALDREAVSCRQLAIATHTGQFHPGGQVTVTVTCQVSLAQLTLLQLPGSRQVSGTFTAPIDQWRSQP
ncbi:TadE/TadG family type IV pilus assembly protein [Actinomadura rupiterrae]|uniref:TadE/TadG family type IV pilus assembly protein n=1 Tax=Actinomadura rupiterrae TaxID=559627 RepID=UPI0020A396B9|nr:TadE/TadG family type IV pilus assembly protein [Actinomadura rupiterrae]MCP2338914.1 Flp pilus assembly protein TadG [Actinomadura rupiterrae]